jgi:hemerythrin-like domain-containing protein
MSFKNRISQTLHEEHRATLVLVERLEALMAAHRHKPPELGIAGVAPLLADLSSALETEVWRHFDFEERCLFTYLEDGGDREIGAHLTEEHAVIRPIGTELVKLAREVSAQGFDAPRWDKFRRLGRDFCERILAHVHKEEMALVPLIEDTMDAETEARLYREYVENM